MYWNATLILIGKKYYNKYPNTQVQYAYIVANQLASKCNVVDIFLMLSHVVSLPTAFHEAISLYRICEDSLLEFLLAISIVFK